MHSKQVAENFRQGKGSHFTLRPLLAVLLSAGVISSVEAAPEGGIVRAGSAQISDQGTATLIQQSSQRAIIDWRNFSISKDELVQFIQPSASSAALNRVTGDQVSLILGRLDANGQVLLINPNGIILGGGSQINVGSLIASTANLSNDNFMQGRLIFDQPGKPGAGVINGGSITAAEGGLVALVAPHVRNDGLIQARLGKVMLGATDTFTIDLYGDGLVNLALSDASLAQMHDAQGQPVGSLITQAGNIDVGSGQAILVTAEAAKTVLDNLINMSGTILADSAVQEGGRILLLAKGGSVDVSGSLSAQGTSGGQIEVLGDQVHLASTAQLDASGSHGGGTLHVGGAYQGSGDTYRAKATQIDSGAMLNASAITQGNGGEVIVWADGNTSYAGSIQARGGAQGGDGGLVEVSGKQTLDFNGYVDAGASYGNAGSLLLDPTNFNIGISEAGLIARVLRTGTSTAVSASGDINVNYAIDGRGRLAGGGLTLTAGNDLNVNDFIVTNDGNISLQAGSSIFVASGKGLFSGGGNITVAGNDGVALVDVVADGGDIGISSSNGNVTFNGDLVTSAGGTIGIQAAGLVSTATDKGLFTGGGQIDVAGDAGVALANVVADGGNIGIGSSNGNVTLNGNLITSAGGTIGIQAVGSVSTAAGRGLFSGMGDIDVAGDAGVVLVDVVADGGDIGISSINGDVTFNGDLVTSASGTIGIQAAGSVSTATDKGLFTGGGNIDVAGNAGVALANVVADGGNIGIGSALGDVTLNGDLVTSADGTIAIQASGSVSTAAGKGLFTGSGNIDVAGDAGVALINVVASGGDIGISSVNGNITFNGDLVTSADGTIGIQAAGLVSTATGKGLFTGTGNIDVAGDAGVVLANVVADGGNIGIGSALGNITLNGDLGTSAGGTIGIQAHGSVSTAAGKGLFTGGGNIDVAGDGGVALVNVVASGGDIGISSSNGNVTFNGDLVTSADGTIGIQAAGLVSIATDKGLFTGGGNIDVAGNAGVALANVVASGGNIGISSSNGNVTLNGDLATSADGTIGIQAAGLVSIATDKGLFTGVGYIDVAGDAGVELANVVADGGDIGISSSNGNVTLNGDLVTGAGSTVEIQADGDVNINQPIVSTDNSNSLTVTAGHDIKVNAQIDGRPTFGSNPNGTVNMTAGHDIDLIKSILAHSIALTASIGTINAATMTAGTVTLDDDGIPHGEGLFAGDGPIVVTTGDDLSSGIYATTGTVDIRSTGGDVTVDTKLAEILGNVSIKADAGTVNVNQEIANIRSGHNLLITAGTDINLNRQIDALDDSNPLSIVPVAGGSVTFTAGSDVNLNRDLATFNGPVDITATAGTLNIAWNGDESRNYRINSGTMPITVTVGGNLSTGTAIPSGLTFPDIDVSGLPIIDQFPAKLAYIADQLQPWVSLVTTGKLTLTSTAGDVTVDAPIPDTTGEVEINAGDAIVVNGKILSNNQNITLDAGLGGITVNATEDDYGISGVGTFPSIFPGSGDLTLLSLGDVWINTVNGIDTAGKLIIDTRAKIIQGALTHNNSVSPSEVVLTADQGIDSFNVGYSPKITATSSEGSIRLSVDSPGQLDIDAAIDVYTGGFLGALPTIHAGQDIHLSNVFLSGDLVLDAGRDVNVGYFVHVLSLDATAGRNVNFNANVPLDPSTSSIWMDGGDFVVTSTGGNINFSDGSAVHLDDAASFELDASGSVTMYKLETKGPVVITAGTGDITLHNDVGPFIFNPIDTADLNDYDRPRDDVPLFDPDGEGPDSVTLTAVLGNINMQGAQAVNDVFITSGGVLTAAHEIYSNWGDLVITATGGAWESGNVTFHAAPYIQDSRDGGNYWFGYEAIGNQVQLDDPGIPLPAVSPGPPISAPAGPGALTALAAQAPSLASVSGSSPPGAPGTVSPPGASGGVSAPEASGGVSAPEASGGVSTPGASGGGGSDSENATLNASGSGTLSEIIPEDEGTTFAGQSEDIVLVFEGGRGAAQSLDMGMGGGQTDADDALGNGCASDKAAKGSKKAACK